MKEVTLDPYSKEFLEHSWEWLNDEEVRTLTMTPEFTKSEQEAFFLSIEKRTDYYLWGLSFLGTKIGACGLKNVTEEEAEYWGYIGDKSYWGRGVGKKMVELLILEAKKMSLKRLYLKVSKNNERAIGLYLKMGFLHSGGESDILMMGIDLD